MSYRLALVGLMVLTFIVGLFTQDGMPTLSIGAFATSGLAAVAAIILAALSDMKDGQENS